MKNSDLPAMPNSNPETYPVPCCISYGAGLTKREMFAMHAMSSVIDKYNPYESGDFDSSNWEETVKNAVGLADALLTELER